MYSFKTAEEYITAINNAEDPKDVVRIWNHASARKNKEPHDVELIIQLHQACGGKVLEAITVIPKDELLECVAVV